MQGPLVAFAILAAWLGNLAWAFTTPLNWLSPITYIQLLLQTHLYTGLFITAHDAMHGTVSPHKRLNYAIGYLFAGLFAYNYYPRLLPKHHEHHRFVASHQDPDYHDGGFWPWYFSFVRQYVRWPQILLMALTFHTLILFFPKPNVILFWAVASVLSTFQLFYFGTYLPHKGEHAPDNRHKARSQGKNHLWAFLSCYFFGYHYEHHEHPGVPWWKLYQKK
jgi:beta-carotene ketolase (CrtW type)